MKDLIRLAVLVVLAVGTITVGIWLLKLLFVLLHLAFGLLQIGLAVLLVLFIIAVFRRLLRV